MEVMGPKWLFLFSFLILSLPVLLLLLPSALLRLTFTGEVSGIFPTMRVRCAAVRRALSARRATCVFVCLCLYISPCPYSTRSTPILLLQLSVLAQGKNLAFH